MIIVLIVIGILLAIPLLFLVAIRFGKISRTVNEVIDDKVVLKIAVPRYNEKSPIAAEQLFSSLHGMGAGKGKSKDHFSLEIASGHYGIVFILVISSKYKTFIENQFYAQYPEAQIFEIGDYTENFTPEYHYTIKEYGLSQPSYFPIKTFLNFDVDPLAAITSALTVPNPDCENFIQIVCRPVSDSWHKAGQAFVDSMKNKLDGEGKSVKLESGDSERMAQIERKNTKVGFNFSLRILTKAKDPIMSERSNAEVQASFGQYKTGINNSLGNMPGPEGWDATFQNLHKKLSNFVNGAPLDDKLSPIEKYKRRFLDEYEVDIVSTEELASLYHLPNKTVETPNIAWVGAKKLEYPLNIPTENSRIMGVTDYRGIHIPFGIKDIDRLRHMYIIGKTGVGKSTFMKQLIYADIYEGKGVAYIDPHGDDMKEVLSKIPPHRMKDVVIFDPGDSEFPVGFNLLQIKPGENRSLVADGLVSVFKKEFDNSWGPRLEYILTNTLLSLLECEDVSLLALPRILTDKNYRKFLLKQVKDPVLIKFWEEEYAYMARTAKDVADNAGSILNKVGRFTTNPLIRNIIGQSDSTIDFEDIMNNRKILLINLSQGKIGEENMALLGGMLITRLYTSTVKRVAMEKKDRQPFYLYVDEFQNFATSTFEKILSEARKFGLGLVVAHQFIDQLDEGIQHAIFGNIGSMINFAVGPRDADVLIKEYTPYLISEDLVNQERSGFVTKLSIDFQQSRPFTAKSVIQDFPDTHFEEPIMDASRKNYAKTRPEIEKIIYKWTDDVFSDAGELLSDEEAQKLKDRKEAKLDKQMDMAKMAPWEKNKMKFGNQQGGGGQGGGGQRFNNDRPPYRDDRSGGGSRNDDRPRDDRPPRSDDSRNSPPRQSEGKPADQGRDNRPPRQSDSGGSREERAPRDNKDQRRDDRPRDDKPRDDRPRNDQKPREERPQNSEPRKPESDDRRQNSDERKPEERVQRTEDRSKPEEKKPSTEERPPQPIAQPAPQQSPAADYDPLPPAQ